MGGPLCQSISGRIYISNYIINPSLRNCPQPRPSQPAQTNRPDEQTRTGREGDTKREGDQTETNRQGRTGRDREGTNREGGRQEQGGRPAGSRQTRTNRHRKTDIRSHFGSRQPIRQAASLVLASLLAPARQLHGHACDVGFLLDSQAATQQRKL